MKTDDLISALSADLEPVNQRAVAQRLALGLGIGMVLSFALMAMWLGFRPDMDAATGTPMFWMKFVYALSIAAFGFVLADRMARPDVEGGIWAALIFAPLAFMAAMAIYRYMGAPEADRTHLVMGGSSQVCARNIVILSLPIFTGLFWSLRALAPTRQTLAGAVAGVLAGAAGTFIYAFHCTEYAAPFVAIWYTLGIAAMGILGAALGRMMLRW
ncbi:MAG: DUF1109 domain-containing protein [Alphaproteobacteria bacterium]|nr:DUF1109 domain-containing protein [Alphaproteobacteria bacterium]